MPSTRTELPWDKISKETTVAVSGFANEECGGKLFVVNCKYLADYIDERSSQYPTITNGVSFKGLQSRLCMSMNKMGWKKWTTSNAGGKGMKFVVPAGVVICTMKRCKKCNEPKLLEEYHKCTGTKDGKHAICKTCRNSYQKSLNYKNKMLTSSSSEAKRKPRNLACPSCGKVVSVRYRTLSRNFVCYRAKDGCGHVFTRAEAEAAAVVESVPAFKRKVVEVMEE